MDKEGKNRMCCWQKFVFLLHAHLTDGIGDDTLISLGMIDTVVPVSVKKTRQEIKS